MPLDPSLIEQRSELRKSESKAVEQIEQVAVGDVTSFPNPKSLFLG
jgi:hypothetical protein